VVEVFGMALFTGDPRRTFGANVTKEKPREIAWGFVIYAMSSTVSILRLFVLTDIPRRSGGHAPT